MDYRERGSHVRGVYPTQYTWRMVTAMVKQEEKTDTRVRARHSKKTRREERGHEGESLKQGLTRLQT